MGIRRTANAELQDLMAQFWCLAVTHTRCPRENALLKKYTNWYATRIQFVFVDRHPQGSLIRDQVRDIAKIDTLPILFVNKQVVGPMEEVHSLDEAKKLKDLLHFGFKWKDVGRIDTETKEPLPTGPLPSKFDDAQFFRGIHRGGAPPTAQVTPLPQYAPNRFE